MRTRKLLVLTTWAFKDGLIQSYCLPYLKIIHEIAPSAKIYLVTQEKGGAFNSKQEELEAKEHMRRSQIFLYPQKYYRMGFKKLIAAPLQFVHLWVLILFKRVTDIHCFCTPAGALGYLLSVLTNRRLVIDSYEPHAEAMVENGTWTRKSYAFRLLWKLERKQSQRAYYCIAAASGMRQYAREKYGVNLHKFGVKPACVDLKVFSYNAASARRIRETLGWSDKIVGVYAGKLGGIYLDKEVFDFLAFGYGYWGERFRVLMLTGTAEDEIKELCSYSGLPNHVVYATKVPFSEVPGYLSAGDFALTPVKPVPSKKYCTPIKDGEYWSIGLPVIIPENISDDSQIIMQNNAGVVLHEFSNEEYERAVRKIDDLLREDREVLRNRIRNLARQFRPFSIAEDEYRKLYSSPTRSV
jgi:hypothetical protein